MPARSSASSVDHSKPGGDLPFAVDLAHHITPDILRAIPSGTGGLALDLGCGTCDHREMLEKLHYHYVGVDISPRGADVLCDAHRLPFSDEAFDLIITVAAFEHLHNPFAAMQEAARVLKSGKPIVGGVAFLEPFHGDSYFHMTHLGVQKLLESAGLRALRIWAGPNVLDVLFKNMAHPVLRLLPRPLQWPTRLAARLSWAMSLRLWLMRDSIMGWRKARHLSHQSPMGRDFYEMKFASGLYFVGQKP